MLKVGNKTYLASPDESVQVPQGSYLIRLKPCFPLFAFGYGWHETTKAYIEEVESMDLSGKNVLDIGTGCGILAILAKMRGASEVVGLDNDWQSVRIAKDNVELNSVDVTILDKGYQEYDRTDFDIVFCNIDFYLMEPTVKERFENPGRLELKAGHSFDFLSKGKEVIFNCRQKDEWKFEERVKSKIHKKIGSLHSMLKFKGGTQ